MSIKAKPCCWLVVMVQFRNCLNVFESFKVLKMGENKTEDLVDFLSIFYRRKISLNHHNALG
jgi:hypothetical protein